MSAIISVKNIAKSFQVGVQTIPVLKNISFETDKGDFLIIIGPSGCGKSTLLHTILGLEPPNSGQVVVLDKDLYQNTTEDEISEFRKKHIGMIFQQPNWIKSLTVIENVAFPLSLLGVNKVESLQKAAQALETIGMVNWAHYIPTELSSGQQQKVALARGIINNPEIIVADEPTGNLDFESGQELMMLLSKLNNQGTTVLMITHDLAYLKYAKIAVKIFNGEIKGIYQGKDKENIAKSSLDKRSGGGIRESGEQANA